MNPNGKSTLEDTLQTLEETIGAASIAEIPPLLGILERLKALSWSRMVIEPQHTQREATGKTAMTAKDVAPLLGVQPTMVYELVRQKKLKFYKVGKYIRFREGDVQEFLANGGA